MLENAVKVPCCSCSGVTMGLAVLATYIGLVQLLRFRRVRGMKFIDVKTDPSSVYRETAMLEFPFTVSKALEFAQFRAFGVPSISKLLHKTGEFCKRAGKRYDDTDLLFREFWENDSDTNRSKISIARINAIHGMYSKQISNADMLYTLCLFVTEPVAWIDRYEWRRCTDVEKEGLLGHFVLLGEQMGIKGGRDWKTWDDALAFQLAYEAKYFEYHESNNALAVSTLDLFISNVPSLFQGAARWAVYAIMDPFLLKTMGLPQVPTLLRWALASGLLLRAMIVRFLLPPRPEFFVSRRTPFVDDTTITAQCCMKARYQTFTDLKLSCMRYKDGYRIGDLGTSSCPAGRLMHDVPTFTGHGGGGSGVAGAAEDEPLASMGAAPRKKQD